MVLIALICHSNAEGRCEATLADLAEFARVTIQTARTAVVKLINSTAIHAEKADRDRDGLFGTNIYVLALSDPRIRDLFDRFRRVIAANYPHPEIEMDRNPDSEEFAEPMLESSTRPYKDSRAGARASKSFILHSLPSGHGIEDSDLADQVAQALAVCGPGTEGVDVMRLAHSLAYNIPRALENGFSFDKDILPCVRHHTLNERTKALNRFDVTFREDLPAWRKFRLRKLKGHRSSKSGLEVRTADASNLLDRAIQRRDSLDEHQQHADRIAVLRRVIWTFESGEETDLRGLTFELPQGFRDLQGQELRDALSPIIDERRNELNKLTSKATGPNQRSEHSQHGQ